MKRVLKWGIVLTFLLAAVLACSISASAKSYEPDGTVSTEYLFPSDECNRTLIVNCVDANGTLLKQVQFKTKKGEEDSAYFSLYGYDFYAFESDQGLWETCKLKWTSGNGVLKADIDILYKFISGLSSGTVTATVTCRKQEIKVNVYHRGRSDAGIEYNYYWFASIESSEYNLSYGDTFTCRAKSMEGYYLMTGFSFTVIEWYNTYERSVTYPIGCPNLISGAFRYTTIEDAYGITDASDLIEWDTVYNHDVKDQHKEYTAYHEDEDGVLCYAYDRVMTLYIYYDRYQYTVSFDSNGGTGTTDSIRQYYDMTITIPNFTPTRENYEFLGWSQSSGANTATYVAGDSYTVKRQTTLYAVWYQEVYEFSASNLTVYAEKIYPNSVIRVNVRTDNWDKVKSYTAVPVELYYDGTLLATQLADFEAYGIAWLDFYVDVGTVLGEHEIKIWINRENMLKEGNKGNNIVKTVITVENDEYAFGISPVPNNAPYTEGTDVITSYLISNDSIGLHVYPDMETYVLFTAYYLDEYGEPYVIQSQNWEGLAIPFGESNLVWFKWRVPEGLAGETVYCECSVNTDGALKENNRANNTATLAAEVVESVYSQTTNPTFATQTPNGYAATDLPAESIGSASWKVWEYEDESFHLIEYGIAISENDPRISPDENCSSASLNGNEWTMKSGYGIVLNYTPTLTVLDGAQMPTEEAYTDLQAVRASFSEYGYSMDQGKYCDLVFVNGAWCFAENTGADGHERIHYIPVWVSDGEYAVSVVLTELWTPVGRITAVRNSNAIVIDGSLFDDWYQ
jgi:hypothetical protein